MLTNKQQFLSKEGKWSKYTNLSFFTRCEKCNVEANKVDLAKINLDAKGQAIISEIENMCCFPIVAEEDFLEIWKLNGWTMEKFLKDHMDRDTRRHYNPMQVVCCQLN